MAKYVNSWDQKPNLVSYGAQKNFDYFMQGLRGRVGEDWLPDQTYYRQLIAKTILFRTTQKIVKAEKFPEHQANISTYLIAYLSWRTSQAIDLEGIWQAQKISDELQSMLRTWSHSIDECLRKIAGGRMVSELSKREPCWTEVRELDSRTSGSLALRTVIAIGNSNFLGLGAQKLLRWSRLPKIFVTLNCASWSPARSGFVYMLGASSPVS